MKSTPLYAQSKRPWSVAKLNSMQYILKSSWLLFQYVWIYIISLSCKCSSHQTLLFSNSLFTALFHLKLSLVQHYPSTNQEEKILIKQTKTTSMLIEKKKLKKYICYRTPYRLSIGVTSSKAGSGQAA